MDVKDFFESRFDRYGDSHDALDWSERGQRERFRVLSEVGDLRHASVLDLGCGLGHLYAYLRDRHLEVDYVGYDFSSRFVDHARTAYPEARFEVHDVLQDHIPAEFDYIVCCGIHNLETGTNDADMVHLISGAWQAARRGVAFSMLSAQAPERTPGRHYYDPLTMTAEAQKLTRFVNLRHDYMPHDFTLYLFHDPQSTPP